MVSMSDVIWSILIGGGLALVCVIAGAQIRYRVDRRNAPVPTLSEMLEKVKKPKSKDKPKQDPERFN